MGKGTSLPPVKATEGASGMDLHAAIPKKILLRSGQRVSIPTGLAMEIPEGYEGQVRARSGLALHHGIAVLNSPGTIDCDYRGEIRVILVNLGENPHWISPGDRIAQIVIQKTISVTWSRYHRLTRTKRGSGGFGHTGD